MIRFLYTADLHFGYERRNQHKIPLHDLKAWNTVLAFARDFKPHVWILGGDMLDCGMISHHNHGKPGATEGLKLIADAQAAKETFIEPVEEIVGRDGTLVYLIGNHEDWLTDLTDMLPTLEGLIDLKSLLKLGSRWKIIPQGGAFNLGKLTFIHGDTVKGGENSAKNAVFTYERNVRFGHYHTFQAFTKNSALDYKNAKTGVAVPCLCSKTPKYGEGAPNRWVQGFDYGYVDKGGYFSDAVAIIVDGHCVVNGKSY
jgi:metallophosphoesterase superfamily enzyme